MITSHVDRFDHGSIFRRQDGIICQIVVAQYVNTDEYLYLLVNLYLVPFEMVREWEPMPLEELRKYMDASDNLYRFMGRQPYYAEAEK